MFETTESTSWGEGDCSTRYRLVVGIVAVVIARLATLQHGNGLVVVVVAGWHNRARRLTLRRSKRNRTKITATDYSDQIFASYVLCLDVLIKLGQIRRYAPSV